MSTVALFTDIAFWYPGLGQCVRIRELVFALSKKCALTVYFLGECDENFQKATSQPLPFRLFPFSLSNPIQKALFLEEVRHETYDIALIEYLHLHWICDYLPSSTLKLLDTHDLASVRAKEHEKWGFPLHVSWNQKSEIDIFRRFDRVILIQEEEAKQAAQWIGKDKIMVCPHPMETLLGFEVKKEAQKIAFLASPSHANCHAVQWLHDKVLPRLKGAYSLSIYGAICLKQDLVKACPNLMFEGTVNDLKQFYHSKDLILNPVLFGSGLKIKTVEALAHGMPLISTSAGVAGLSRHSSSFVVADSENAFAQQIEKVALCQKTRKSLSQSAYELSQTHLSVSQCFAPLFSLL